MAGKKSGGKTGAMIGLAGLAAATAAGAYFLYGSKEGAKRRAKVKGWALRAKGEVLDKLETVKDVNEDVYNRIVDAVAKKYEKVKTIDKIELADMAKDLKRHWGNIKKHLQAPVGKSARKSSSKK